jgi:predicted dehydrogenase
MPGLSAGTVATDLGAGRSALLVGAGRRGLGAHLPALLGNRLVEFVAVVDTPQRVAELRASAGLAVPMYGSLDEALGARPPDFAIIATPHDTHAPLALSLLGRGIPTLLEKPPARNAGEFAVLVQASESYATPLAVLRPFFYEPRRRQFIRLLRSSALTDALITVQADVPAWTGSESWRRSRDRAGGGVLIDLGYHFLDTLVSCLGRPDIGLARLAPPGRLEAVEDEATVRLRFDTRRIAAELRLRCAVGLPRRGELTIADKERKVVYSSSSQHAGARVPSESVMQAVYALRRQVTLLLAAGFLEGRGSWMAKLHAQGQVMSLLDDIYAEAATPAREAKEDALEYS